ncbi:hypothetical protein [Poseidonocella sp. HB161398]|uniref:putative PDDEXK endonuclease n=1 Tax=Poseidonocella sp. HB161398 TaxID=2320855 RepID=UPI00110891E0|nr:hypothetical protein [Poseidonocella sp. HB161398]
MSVPPKRKRLSPRGSKQKGDKFERELAAYIAEATGLQCERAPLSGGGVVGLFAGGADLIGTPGIHVEAKRCEAFKFESWLAQCMASITKLNAPEAPVIVARKSRMPIGEARVQLPLDFFLTLYRAWLIQEGYVRPADHRPQAGGRPAPL